MDRSYGASSPSPLRNTPNFDPIGSNKTEASEESSVSDPEVSSEAAKRVQETFKEIGKLGDSSGMTRSFSAAPIPSGKGEDVGEEDSEEGVSEEDFELSADSEIDSEDTGHSVEDESSEVGPRELKPGQLKEISSRVKTIYGSMINPLGPSRSASKEEVTTTINPLYGSPPPQKGSFAERIAERNDLSPEMKKYLISLSKKEGADLPAARLELHKSEHKKINEMDPRPEGADRLLEKKETKLKKELRGSAAIETSALGKTAGVRERRLIKNYRTEQEFAMLDKPLVDPFRTELYALTIWGISRGEYPPELQVKLDELPSTEGHLAESIQKLFDLAGKVLSAKTPLEKNAALVLLGDFVIKAVKLYESECVVGKGELRSCDYCVPSRPGVMDTIVRSLNMGDSFETLGINVEHGADAKGTSVKALALFLYSLKAAKEASEGRQGEDLSLKFENFLEKLEGIEVTGLTISETDCEKLADILFDLLLEGVSDHREYLIGLKMLQGNEDVTSVLMNLMGGDVMLADILNPDELAFLDGAGVVAGRISDHGNLEQRIIENERLIAGFMENLEDMGLGDEKDWKEKEPFVQGIRMLRGINEGLQSVLDKLNSRINPLVERTQNALMRDIEMVAKSRARGLSKGAVKKFLVKELGKSLKELKSKRKSIKTSSESRAAIVKSHMNPVVLTLMAFADVLKKIDLGEI